MRILFLLLIACSFLTADAQVSNGHWKFIDEKLEDNNRWIVPDRALVFELDLDGLLETLQSVPMEFTSAEPIPFVMPFPDGTTQEFAVLNSPIMEPELAEKFPEIQNFRGQGITDRSATLRFDITPKGFHAIIHSLNGTVFIDPYYNFASPYYNVYYDFDFTSDESFVCSTPVSKESEVFKPKANYKSSGGLKTYRCAVAGTGEYTEFHSEPGPANVADGLAGINTSLMRVNSVYEIDFACRLILIANNDLIVYTNPNTDPYNSFGLGENQNNIDNTIGSANYDIGHLFHGSGGGGVASLASVCSNNSKARGKTSGNNPAGDPFDIDYVCHEIGHQFNGQHTQNAPCNSAGSNNAYETGSGTTIMGYAGVCDSGTNVQSNSDDYFHADSLEDMLNFMENGGGDNCSQIISNSNNPPTSDAGGNYTIPKETPFVLEGSGSDPNGDALTYCWEQMNGQSSTQPPLPTNTGGPAFRSLSPSFESFRYLPNINAIVSNSNPTWEVLSSVDRNYTFRLTVRDNNSAGGCYAQDDKNITVEDDAGPFLVTSPNSFLTWQGGTPEVVTWNVAGTNGGAVSCALVDILLSMDGGFTYPITLLSNTPNDGSATISVPNLNTTSARVMVRCSTNIFFDISNSNFSITPGSGGGFSCTDGILNGQETGIDCGGPDCNPCPSCFDGILNQGEDDVDCGGPCISCSTCDDGVQNNGEIDVDCGGPCPACVDIVNVKFRIRLEGALQNGTQMSTQLPTDGFIPLAQPYHMAPYNYNGFEAIASLLDFPANVVDWIYVQARDANDINIIVDERACFLRNDGTVIDLDGSEGVGFDALDVGENYHFALYHRGHMGVISSVGVNVPNASNYDFTTSVFKAYGDNQLKEVNGTYVLHAGDFDGSGVVNILDFLLWFNDSVSVNDYVNYDADLNHLVNVLDFTLWFDNRSVVGVPELQP